MYEIVRIRGFDRLIALRISICTPKLEVLSIRAAHNYFSSAAAHLSKTRTLTGLLASVLTFAVYFLAIGFVLAELGVSLTAYIASASILGVAIAFGSQGIVQDVVSGLTVIFTNLFDIGDMVEVSEQTGLVKSVTMRFTVIESALGADKDWMVSINYDAEKKPPV